MINEVRNTVLSILNKDNNGYLTPDQFNLYSTSAQNEIFEQINYDYSKAVNKRNSHLHTSGLGDVPKRLAETINRFNTRAALTYSTDRFVLPSNYFSLGTISTNSGSIIEVIPQHQLLRLNASLDASPNEDYPVYTIQNDGQNSIKVYPTSITSGVNIDYIRFPKKPKWTYVSLSGGEPLFDQSSVDYQDFELPDNYKMNLIIKILEYAGVQIREEEIVSAAKTDEIQEIQQQS